MVKMDTYKKNFWLIALVAGVVSVPLLTDYVLAGSSLDVTFSKIEAFSQGIGKTFPIRYDLWGIAGQENFIAAFQADVFYIVPALLHLLGMGLGAAYKWTLLLLDFATAAIAFVCFEKCCGRREIGFIGSLLYTFCPYRCSEMYLTGDLSEAAAWTFLPVIALGLKLLYTGNTKEEGYGRLWKVLTWGFTMLSVSSTKLLAAGAVFAALALLAMGKETLRRETLAVLGKTVIAAILVNAWFWLPMLMYLKNPIVTGTMLVHDMRSMGMYLTQYLTVFPLGGNNIRMAEEGMKNAQAMGPGIAVTLLVFLYMGLLFTGRQREPEGADKSRRFALRMLCASAVLVFLSTNLFPWDILEDKNFLFSVVLALIHTPAKLGAAADISLILVSCLLLGELSGHMGKREYCLLLLTVGAVSFGTTQFMLGKILISQPFVRKEEIAALGTIQFPLLTQEPVIWRFAEGISIAALCGCAIMWFVRRRKSGRQI